MGEDAFQKIVNMMFVFVIFNFCWISEYESGILLSGFGNIKKNKIIFWQRI